MLCSKSTCIGLAWIGLLTLALAYRVILGSYPLADFCLTVVLFQFVVFRYFGYYYKSCRPLPPPVDTLPSSTEAHPEAHAEAYQNDVESDGLILPSTPNPLELQGDDCGAIVNHRRRMFFLDNLKIFLTFVVVVHHVTCAFGGCGPKSWFLIVGYESTLPLFDAFAHALAALDQAYFMPLFFFISAYFVPSSLAKKGRDRFFMERGHRILLPALFVTLAICPAAIVVAQLVEQAYSASSLPVGYIPVPGPAWFLLWVLLFAWIYASLQPATTITNATDAGLMTPAAGSFSFPGTARRMLWGATFCGLLQLGVNGMIPGTFASMPTSIGALTCDMFMFGMGILARRHGWLNRSLMNQMDISPALLTLFVILEGTGMLTMLSQIMLLSEGDAVAPLKAIGTLLLFSISAGLFCVDMSLWLLVIFQQWINVETPFSRFLAKAAYTVYLIHPITVTAITGLYIWLYNSFFATDSAIVFDQDGVGHGGGDSFALGWLFVLILSQLITWPLSYVIANLPLLNKIL